MIRLLVRCVTQRYHLTQANSIILSNNKILLSSSVRHYQISNNVHLNQQSATDEAKDSNPISPNIEQDRITGKIVDVLQEKLNCSHEWTQHFCTTYSELLTTTSDVLKSIELLLANGVRTNVILDNPKMLTLSESQLRMNLSIVKDMKPVDINDFVALVKCSQSELLKLKETAERERNVVPKNHRIYFLSEAMDIEPCIITKFVSERLFMLTEPFEMIDQKLQILLKYIAPIDILHDLWAFKYKTAMIEARLNRARDGQVEKLMPWLIRCSEKKISTSIKMASDAKAISGNKPLVKYLSDRLKYDVRTTESIMQKHPCIFSCRVVRVKEILDYLFEAGFAPADIAVTPRVFSRSLNTVRTRVDEMKSLGCQPQLYIICKSKTEYDKFVEKWKRVRDRLKEKNIIKE